MKKINVLIITIVFLVSCQSTETEKTITIDNKYELTIPSFLVKVNDLSEEASLQYQHMLKQFFVIVIDDDKEEYRKALELNNLTDIYSNDIEGYSALLTDSYEQALSMTSKSSLKDTTINNLPAKLLTAYSRFGGVETYYNMAFIEGEHNYYQLIVWTLASREYQYQDKMRKLIYTFKEL